MRFRGVSAMEQREAFVAAAGAGDANVRAVCRSFGISPTTGYKWLARAAAGVLAERSRRPHRSPRATGPAVEAQVLAVRQEHPSWGGRKIHHVLRLRGVQPLPHANTINGILHRHGLIDAEASRQRRHWQRFERAAPTSCGRWTSRDTLRWPAAGAAIP